MNIKVQLRIPEAEKRKLPAIHGEHYGYDGAVGTIIAPAGNGGAWVQFGETPSKYVGCPVAWLYPMEVPDINAMSSTKTT